MAAFILVSGQHPGIADRLNRFRSRLVQLPSTDGLRFMHESLPPEDWRFFVVEADPSIFEGDKGFGAIFHVEACSRLTDVELDLGFRLNPNGGSNCSTAFLSSFGESTDDMDHPDGEDFGEKEVQYIRELSAPLEALCRERPNVYRSFELFGNALQVEVHPPLQILGLFAVMESLITHNPHGEYDSISHQIATKIPLLNRRFDEPIDYSVFLPVAEAKVWKRLYAYRSRIAHGGDLSFDGELQVLRGIREVSAFMRGVCKRLLRQTLREPDLVVDLREC